MNVARLSVGVAGFNAAQMAVGLQANVVILDQDLVVIERLADYFHGRARIRYSTHETIKEELTDADQVIGAVLIPGAAAPKLVSKSMLQPRRAYALRFLSLSLPADIQRPRCAPVCWP